MERGAASLPPLDVAGGSCARALLAKSSESRNAVDNLNILEVDAGLIMI